MENISEKYSWLDSSLYKPVSLEKLMVVHFSPVAGGRLSSEHMLYRFFSVFWIWSYCGASTDEEFSFSKLLHFTGKWF